MGYALLGALWVLCILSWLPTCAQITSFLFGRRTHRVYVVTELGTKVSSSIEAHVMSFNWDHLGSTHGKHGYLILFLAVVLSVIGILAAGRRLIAAIRSREKKTFKLFWRSVILHSEPVQAGLDPECAGLVEDPEEFTKMKDRPQSEYRDLGHEVGDTAQWANEVHHQRFSSTSDRTLYAPTSPVDSEATFQNPNHCQSLIRVGSLRRTGELAFTILERILVIAGFAMLLTGIVIYTGTSSILSIPICFFNVLFRRWMQRKLREWLFSPPNQCVVLPSCLYLKVFNSLISRGRHILVLRLGDICQVFGIFRR